MRCRKAPSSAKYLDERQVALRDHAYLLAFRAFASIVITCSLVALLAATLTDGVVVTAERAIAVTAALILSAVAMPSISLATLEPAAE